MTASYGTKTTNSIGWYGSYTVESGDFCEPFDQELYESQLREIILIDTSGKPSSLFTESQHPCGVASFVYTKRNLTTEINHYHAGYINEPDSGRVRPKTNYILEFELQGLTGDFFGANADSESKYKITNTLKDKKPVYKKLFEDWYIFFDDNRLRYILADGINDYTNFLVGELQRPNGIYRSLIDEDQIGISEGVEDFSSKTTCEVEISYEYRDVTGAYYPRKYNDYFESSDIKGSSGHTITENTHFKSSCFLDIKNLKLSTEIGRGFGSSVNPKNTLQFTESCDTGGSLQLNYEADVDQNCDVSAIEDEYINDGTGILNLVQRYDANYTTTNLSVDEIINNESVYLGDSPPEIINENGNKFFKFNGSNYFTIDSSLTKNTLNKNEFSIYFKFKPETETQNGILLSRWLDTSSSINASSSFKIHTTKIETYKTTNIFKLSNPSVNEWHDLLITFSRVDNENGVVEVYIDQSNKQTFFVTTQDFTENSFPLVVGGKISVGQTFKSGFVGQINDIRIFNRRINLDEKNNIFNKTDYDTNRKVYSLPTHFDRSLYQDLFYENKENLLNEIDIQKNADSEILQIELVSNNICVVSVVDDRFNLDFFYNGVRTLSSKTNFPVSSKVKFSSDKMFLCHTNELIVSDLQFTESGAVQGYSEFTKLQSFIYNDFFDVSSDGKYTFVTRKQDNNLIVSSYILESDVLTPMSLSGNIKDVTSFNLHKSFILVTLTNDTLILYKEIDSGYEIKWNLKLEESETALESKIIECVLETETKYFVATRYLDFNSGIYSDKYVSSSYVKNNVGYIKIREIKYSESENSYEIVKEPIQVIAPPYDNFGNGFLETQSFAEVINFYSNFLIIGSPGYKCWYYTYSNNNQYVFTSAVKDNNLFEIESSYMLTNENSFMVSAITSGTSEQFSGKKYKMIEYNISDTANEELEILNNTKLEFTNYGYNNIAWFRFGDDYVSNSDKFVFLDRSGKYNHLSCSFNDENGNFVSPFDGKFLGPCDGNPSIYLSGNSKLDFSCKIKDTSFSINIWYMVTHFNSSGYNVLLSSKFQFSENENGFCILADGRTMIGNKILEEDAVHSDLNKWKMATFCYDNINKSVNHFINGNPSFWNDDINFVLEDEILRIGREFIENDANSFNGYLADVKVFDKLLSPDDIKDEYEKSWKYFWLKSN